jgi:hypothetical protein
MSDKNGKMISRGDTVKVDAPKRTDYYKQAFQGEVLTIGVEMLIVVDQNGDCWDVDSDSVEVV